MNWDACAQRLMAQNNNYHPLSQSRHIGEDLRHERQSKGLTHQKVAQDLNLQTAYVEAIETLDRDTLPAIGYALGYVRTYAQYLGKDGNQAVARFKVDSEVPKNLGRRNQPHFVPERKIKLPRGFIPALSVFGAAIMMVFWYASNTDSLANVTNVDAIANPALPTPTQSEPLSANILTVRATGPSWVQVKDAQGNILVSRIFVKGDTYVTETGSRMVLSARDGGVLDLYAGEERLGALGKKGVSFSAKPIDAAVLIPELADIPLVPLDTTIEQ